MAYSTFLTDEIRPLVLDTSVLINLHACSYGERILSAIPNDIMVAQVVAAELEHETSRQNGEQNFLRDLLINEKATIVAMTDNEFDIFAELTCKSPSLDDGEAATIAIAVRRGLMPIIDEKRGRNYAKTLMGGQEPGWSLDLLRHPSAIQTLGRDVSGDALYLALREGRMRIPYSSSEDVLNLIGIERALNCPCLPNFKRLQQTARISA